jgi:pyrimidine-nucleoside phosphorylase
MNPAFIIAKKRDGGELAADEIEAFIGGFTRGEVHDYQASALAMAIYLRGMTDEETAALTDAMFRSGTRLRWPEDSPPHVDKHSTGGIGDKTSLVLAPLLACCGAAVPMISGRGLGPTGGTLDKLDSIPGFRTDLTSDEIQRITDRVGCVITGASAEIAPADRKLYALRDVTGTVASIPLITASIMSKKLAEGLDALVLDVKHGSGAFMKTLQDAGRLGRSLVETGRRMNVATTALVTDMHQPLGAMAGNAVEVNESVALLQGEVDGELRTLTLALGAEVLVSAGVAASREDAKCRLTAELDSGRALEKFREMVTAQGGALEAPREVATPYEIRSPASGYIARIDTEQLGLAIIELGGGRKRQGDRIDHAVGLEMHVRIGDRVERGQRLVTLYEREDHPMARRMVLEALEFSNEPGPPPKLIEERVGP